MRKNKIKPRFPGAMELLYQQLRDEYGGILDTPPQPINNRKEIEDEVLHSDN